MGEVHLAKDTKLDREVAVKVLPSTFSENKERLARFEREADFAAYDVTPDSKCFLVLLPQDDDTYVTSNQAILVLNWFEELKRLIPTNG